MMRLQKESRILRALGQAKQLPTLIQCCLDLPARDAEEEQSPQRWEEVRRFSQLTAQNVRARVGHLNVWRRPVLGGKQGGAQGDLEGELFAGALGRVRQGREQLYSPAREHHGLLIGEDAGRVPGRHQEIVRGLREVAGRLKEQRQFGGHVHTLLPVTS